MKHPVLQNRVRLIVWWLVWIFLGLGQSLLFYFAFGKFAEVIVPDIIVSFTVYSGLALALWYPFRFFNNSFSKPLVLITNIVTIGAISIFLWIMITKLIVTQIEPADTNLGLYWNATFPYRVGTGVFIYGLIILTYYLFTSLSNLAEKNATESKLESLLKETELRMLRSQINPHFLFNTLNSITSLTVTDPEKARSMVIKLSDFMRYALSRKDEQPVTLQSELDNLRLYLDIEKVRFGDRLSIEENIDPGTLSASLPVMLLQPLYENAIKHGVYESSEMVTIKTNVAFTDNFIELTISNDFDPEASPAKGTGTGLLNVSRRLELLYGKRASIRTDKLDNVFTVKIYIPADFTPASGN
jgi:two-component system, LytTR family, sensor kinase